MSKKFDEEYLAALEDSTPDLWDRIESNIDENLVRDLPKAKTKKKNYSNKITYIALPIAALALALVLIPMAMGRMGSDDAASVNMMAYDMVEESMEEDYAEETSAGMMEEAVAEETTEEVAEASNERVEDAPQDFAEEVNEAEDASPEESTVLEAADGTEVTTSSDTDATEAEEATPAEKMVEYFEGTFVVLRYEADVLPDISVQELGYQYVYVVRVMSTDYTHLSVGEEITIYTTEEIPVDLAEVRLKIADAMEGYLVVEKLN